MVTAFLGLNPFDGTTPQVKRYLNASPGNVGNAFGAITASHQAKMNHTNRVISFGGDEKTFLALTAGTVYRTTDEFLNFTGVVNQTGISGAAKSTGFHVVDANGTPRVCFLYAVDPVTARGMSSDDGVTWSDTGSIGSLQAGSDSGAPGIVDEIVYHNVLYTAAFRVDSTGVGGVNAIWYYDPGAGSIGSINVSVGSGNNVVALAVWRDMLVMLRPNIPAVSLTWNLTDITTGAVIQRVSLGVDANGGEGSKPGVWVDPASGDLIAVFYSSGLKCYSINSAYSVTNITGTVLPAAVTALSSAAKCRPHMDIEASLGSATPAIYLFFANNGTAGTSYALYQWNGKGAVMTLVDSGGSVSHALGINNRPVGGQFCYTSGQLRLRVVSRTPVAGGVRYGVVLSGPTGAEACSVKAYYDPAATEKLSQGAALVNPSVGALTDPGVAGSEWTGLVADRTTVYEITWAAQIQGVPQGARYKFGLSVIAA